ncbi:MAG: haloacid dehalogenase [Candidatus Heimdallarchaeaceae archaeon]
MIDISNFQEIASKIEKILIESDKAREDLMSLSRTILKCSGQSIENFHRKQFEKAKSKLEEAEGALNIVNELQKDQQGNYRLGIISAAMQEYAEAKLLNELFTVGKIPSYEQINVTEAAYLLGVADLIGELRRYILEKLVEGDVEEAKDYYETMKELYATFMQIECGKNLVSDFRRKKDTARILVERTLSDLFVAVQGKKLEERLNKSLDN